MHVETPIETADSSAPHQSPSGCCRGCDSPLKEVLPWAAAGTGFCGTCADSRLASVLAQPGARKWLADWAARLEGLERAAKR